LGVKVGCKDSLLTAGWIERRQQRIRKPTKRMLLQKRESFSFGAMNMIFVFADYYTVTTVTRSQPIAIQLDHGGNMLSNLFATFTGGDIIVKYGRVVREAEAKLFTLIRGEQCLAGSR
jgi:hypothetical protein